MKKIIVANWKINPQHVDDAVRRAQVIDRGMRRMRGIEAVIAPPFPFLAALKKHTRNLILCAQDVSCRESGAYTGEVSRSMLESVGARVIIVGHSERREHNNENDDVVNKKIKAALSRKTRVILCVGEKDRQPDNFQLFVKQQILSAFRNVAKQFSKQVIIAYEPVWAIGTGKTVNPNDLYEMAIYIRRTLLDVFSKKAAHTIPVLYGGSIDSKNAKYFLGVEGVNGLLVGGASLNPHEFLKIADSAASMK